MSASLQMRALLLLGVTAALLLASCLPLAAAAPGDPSKACLDTCEQLYRKAMGYCRNLNCQIDAKDSLRSCVTDCVKEARAAAVKKAAPYDSSQPAKSMFGAMIDWSKIPPHDPSVKSNLGRQVDACGMEAAAKRNKCLHHIKQTAQGAECQTAYRAELVQCAQKALLAQLVGPTGAALTSCQTSCIKAHGKCYEQCTQNEWFCHDNCFEDVKSCNTKCGKPSFFGRMLVESAARVGQPREAQRGLKGQTRTSMGSGRLQGLRRAAAKPDSSRSSRISLRQTRPPPPPKPLQSKSKAKAKQPQSFEARAETEA